MSESEDRNIDGGKIILLAAPIYVMGWEIKRENQKEMMSCLYVFFSKGNRQVHADLVMLFNSPNKIRCAKKLLV